MRVIFNFLISLKQIFHLNNNKGLQSKQFFCIRFLWFCHVTHNEASMLHMSFEIFVCIKPKNLQAKLQTLCKYIKRFTFYHTTCGARAQKGWMENE